MTRRDGAIVTIGTFDGVHLGHQRLIRVLVDLAGERGLAPVVLLFRAPPRFLLEPGRATALLTLAHEREDLLRGLGVGDVVTLDFDEACAALRPSEFFDGVVLRGLGARGLVVGPDFAIGKGRAGDTAWLRLACVRRDMVFRVQPALEEGGRKVSSTAIRTLLEAGDVAAAARLLGRPYSVTAPVALGEGIGRRLEFPTANLDVPAGKLVPRGVYAARVSEPARPPFPDAAPRTRLAVLNAGTRPTIAGAGRLQVEVHIPGFNGDLYGRLLTVEFLSRIRGERRFPSLSALKAQIRLDVAAAMSPAAIERGRAPGYPRG